MKLVVIIVISIFLFGCASGIPLQKAQLKTAGLEISTVNENITIRPFIPFKPVGMAKSACYTDATYATITPILFSGAASAQLKIGIKAGAIPVTIQLDNGQNKLFGRLLFCPIDKTADAYGITEYEIYVPDNYIQSALQGRLTSVYAKTSLKSGYNEYTWILWLSKEPI